ncbi:MAG: hypothetical protein LBS14_01690, partial [Holosporaceae bacterium]|nr:hypothetical protein [Holosporaceae bacterium]
MGHVVKLGVILPIIHGGGGGNSREFKAKVPNRAGYICQNNGKYTWIISRFFDFGRRFWSDRR